MADDLRSEDPAGHLAGGSQARGTDDVDDGAMVAALTARNYVNGLRTRR